MTEQQPGPTPPDPTPPEPTPPEPTAAATEWIIPDAARLEALAEFAAGAGHEINNPLATIIGRAQLLLKDEHDPQRRQMLLAIGAQAYRIRDMIGDTMLFARPPKPELQDVKMADIVGQVVSRQLDQMAESGCTLTTTVPADLVLRADPAQLAIVLSELLRNSRQAMPPGGGPIEIRAARRDAESVQIEIEDHGRGFSETERIHAFDPFFSGRQAGRGLGFGLPKCWQIIRQHGGRIEIESQAGGPTIVRIEWRVVSGEW
jgi:signal transduction histidine kinase